MTLPASGPLSLSQIAAEFGVSAPYKLTDFYGKGGAPASGAIKITDFYGRSALSITGPSPNPVEGYGTASGTETVYSSETTVTVTGGSGVTYLWEYVSGTTGMSPTNSTGATTAFSKSLLKSQTISADWRCKVISGGVTYYSNNVTINLFNTGV